MYNIFQANETIKRQICKSLDLDSKDIFFASPLYFTAFFYLQKRFGDYFILDDHKDAAIWSFKVKCFHIQVLLSSSNVTFMVFGPKPYVPKTPLWAKMNRMSQKGLYVNPFSLLFDEAKWEPLFKKHLDSKGIGYEEATQKDFDSFCELVEKEGDAVVKEQKKHYKDEEYSNSYTLHAKRTLDQFLKNMLTPIWVNDVGYNIKGRCGYTSDYENNVEITKINHQKPQDHEN